MKICVCFIYLTTLMSSMLLAATNTVVIRSKEGTLVNRPVSLGRVFKQGEIPQFAKADVPGITQCDVKNRWPDGSLKFAIVSFILENITPSGVTVSFSNQADGNNTGYLTSQELSSSVVLDDYDFDGQIELSGELNATVSAREMLQQGRFLYWLQGPIVTALVIEDKDPNLPYDTDSDHNIYPLHPIFEAWFYPSNHSTDLGFTLENCWASSDPSLSMRDVSYQLTVRVGAAGTVAIDPYDSYPMSHTHIARTRWHKRHFTGGNPGEITIDHNLAYLAKTKAIPNFDTSFTPPETLLVNQYSAWQSEDKTLDGGLEGIGSFGWDIDQGGGSEWIGLFPRWGAIAIYGGDHRPWEMVYKNADLAGYMVYHFRERDPQAGSGNAFDAKDGATSGIVDTFGKIVSINARKGVQFYSFNQCAVGDNRIQTAETLGRGNWSLRYGNWFDTSHMPDIAYLPYLSTGRFYYLEELQMEASYTLGFVTFCTGTGDGGYYSNISTRGDGWAFRTLSYAAFLSPDNMPEKDYFVDKLGNIVAFWEGQRGVALSDPENIDHWINGQNQKIYVNQVITTPKLGPPTLHLWAYSGGVPGSESAPVRTDLGIQRITSPWMENFVILGLGVARDFGFPTEGLLKFMAQNRFNQILNPMTSPFLIEAYRQAAVTSENNWVAHWSEVDGLHNVPTNWTGGGYDWQARAALSMLHPYQCEANATTGAGSYSGESVWKAYIQNDWSARQGDSLPNKNWTAPENSAGAPLWVISPRVEEDIIRPVRPGRLRQN